MVVVVVFHVVVVMVVVDPTNLPLKFVIGSGTAEKYMTLSLCGGGGRCWWWWWSKVLFMSHPNFELS